MKTFVICVLLLLTIVFAEEPHATPRPVGVVYGIVSDQDGRPAKSIGLTASPLDAALGTILPRTQTNDAGEFRFENLGYGRWTVLPEDEDAGYSSFATDRFIGAVLLSEANPAGQLNLTLPPKAGFLRIHLKNRKTGADVPAMRVELRLAERPKSFLYRTSCSSNHVVLIPPDKDILVHVTSDGSREWDQSTGAGKLIRLSPGAQATLDVQLDPTKE